MLKSQSCWHSVEVGGVEVGVHLGWHCVEVGGVKVGVHLGWCSSGLVVSRLVFIWIGVVEVGVHLGWWIHMGVGCGNEDCS